MENLKKETKEEEEDKYMTAVKSAMTKFDHHDNFLHEYYVHLIVKETKVERNLVRKCLEKLGVKENKGVDILEMISSEKEKFDEISKEDDK